jgi:hypothetical protein
LTENKSSRDRRTADGGRAGLRVASAPAGVKFVSIPLFYAESPIVFDDEGFTRRVGAVPLFGAADFCAFRVRNLPFSFSLRFPNDEILSN